MTNCKCGCECHKVEKNSLAKKLKGNFPYAGERIMSDANWESTAKVAVEHFCELVDSISFDHLFDETSKKEKIKHLFREQA